MSIDGVWSRRAVGTRAAGDWRAAASARTCRPAPALVTGGTAHRYRYDRTVEGIVAKESYRSNEVTFEALVELLTARSSFIVRRSIVGGSG